MQGAVAGRGEDLMPQPDKPTSLIGVVTQVASSIDGNTVVIELICTDDYAAQVVFDDVRARLDSEDGLRMTLKLRSVEVTKVSDR
jgi:hypothetical protein